jgi:hypothetical protein
VGRLAGGKISGGVAVAGTTAQETQIRVARSGDVLVAMVAGEFGFAKAWGSGRVRVQASVRDVLRLRSLL